MRIFSKDDTNKWEEGFGDGSAGNLTVSSSIQTGGGNVGIYHGPLTGTVGAYTATVANGWTWLNKPCLIHQSNGSGGTGAGYWELNWQTQINATTATFKYPLQNTYTTGAQIVTANMYDTLTVNSGVTISTAPWAGTATVGGITVIFAKKITGTGTISVYAAGYRGGTGANQGGDWKGTQGEGYPNYNQDRTYASNGQGGGGGYNTGGGAKPSGGGGGNVATGSQGAGGNGTGGYGGAANPWFSNTGSNIAFGGGGGSGSGYNQSAGNGGTGGGLLFLFAEEITSGLTYVGYGSVGGNAPSEEASAGGGSGGGYLYFCAKKLHIGASNTNGNSGGAGYGRNGAGGAGGAGGITARYSQTYAYTSYTQTPTAIQDDSLESAKSGFFAFFN